VVARSQVENFWSEENTPRESRCSVLSPSSLELYVSPFGGTFMTIQQEPNVPGAAWRAIINRESPAAFASAFGRDPVLVASVANAAAHGAAAIPSLFKASAAIYETIAFTTP
jgi:hypothetical protein